MAITTISSDPVPLEMDSYGAIRVSKTRMTLDLVIGAYLSGLTPEEIATQYDILELGDIYMVIGYYLHHKHDVDEYLREREQYANEVRARIEAAQGSQDGLREKLLARLHDKR